MTDSDIEEIKATKEALMTVFNELSAKLYQQAQSADAQPGVDPNAEQQQSGSDDDDIVDADYKEV